MTATATGPTRKTTEPATNIEGSIQREWDDLIPGDEIWYRDQWVTVTCVRRNPVSLFVTIRVNSITRVRFTVSRRDPTKAVCKPRKPIPLSNPDKIARWIDSAFHKTAKATVGEPGMISVRGTLGAKVAVNTGHMTMRWDGTALHLAASVHDGSELVTITPHSDGTADMLVQTTADNPAVRMTPVTPPTDEEIETAAMADAMENPDPYEAE